MLGFQVSLSTSNHITLAGSSTSDIKNKLEELARPPLEKPFEMGEDVKSLVR